MRCPFEVEGARLCRTLGATTGEWMYLFKPLLGGAVLYVKVVRRSDCIVVSFHENEGLGHEEEDA
jgi:hypothetical protein